VSAMGCLSRVAVMTVGNSVRKVSSVATEESSERLELTALLERTERKRKRKILFTITFGRLALVSPPNVHVPMLRTITPDVFIVNGYFFQ